jgi:predicted adenylyl cyclase CyaB
VTSGIVTSSKPFDLSRLGPFSEEEMSAMLAAIFKKLDIVLRSSGPAPKRPFIDCFGIQKSYKTSATVEMDKVFKRYKYKTYCPAESAEHEDVRAEVCDDPIVFQAKHLTVVTDQFLNLVKNRDYHLAIVSRGLIDMLYWYEKGLRKGIYSQRHVTSAKEWIYELLRLDLVDTFLFFTCSVEAAIKREYGQSVTQKRGSKMNEKDIANALDIYERIQQELELNVPNLPIFHIDTSDMTVKQATEEALRFVLPTICARFQIPDYTFMPYALSLIQKRAKHSTYIEEQLKLYGHPDMERVKKAGWILTKENTQQDIYLSNSALVNPSGEILRLRHEDDTYKFMYKGAAQDQLLSHRLPHSFAVENSEAKNILASHQVIAELKKRRLNFKKETATGEFFTLHIDDIVGLGKFTEIRSRGTQDTKHTRELLELAEGLGFKTNSIVNGNYLSLALTSK